jgi:hypothetical protein
MHSISLLCLHSRPHPIVRLHAVPAISMPIVGVHASSYFSNAQERPLMRAATGDDSEFQAEQRLSPRLGKFK